MNDIFSHPVQTKTSYLLILPSKNGGRTFHLHVTFLCRQKSVTSGIFSSFWKSISDAPFPGDLSCFMQWHWHPAGLCWALSACCCCCWVPFTHFLMHKLFRKMSSWKKIIGMYPLHRVMGFLSTRLCTLSTCPLDSLLFPASRSFFFLFSS